METVGKLYNGVKALISIGQKLKEAEIRIEFNQRVLELQEDVFALQDELRGLRDENEALKTRLDIGERLIPNENAYWLKKPDGGYDGPFCFGCWDGRDRLVRLIADQRLSICSKCTFQLTTPNPPG